MVVNVYRDRINFVFVLAPNIQKGAVVHYISFLSLSLPSLALILAHINGFVLMPCRHLPAWKDSINKKQTQAKRHITEFTLWGYFAFFQAFMAFASINPLKRCFIFHQRHFHSIQMSREARLRSWKSKTGWRGERGWLEKREEVAWDWENE